MLLAMPGATTTPTAELKQLSRVGLYMPYECSGAPSTLIQWSLPGGLSSNDLKLPVLVRSFQYNSRRHATLIVFADSVSSRVMAAVKQLIVDCSATHLAIVQLCAQASNLTTAYVSYGCVQSGGKSLELQLSHPEQQDLQELCQDAEDAVIANAARECVDNSIFRLVEFAFAAKPPPRVLVGNVWWRTLLSDDKSRCCAAYAGVCVAALAMLNDKDLPNAGASVTIELSYLEANGDVAVLTLSQIVRQLDGRVGI